MKKVSIIVPVFNVEKYLAKCLDSLILQTYKNLEIIVIDDGSTDASGNICDKYKNHDSRVKVIHKKNEGVSIARNTGLSLASGDFIFFVDSDDYIKQNTIELLVNSSLQTNADITIGNYVYVDESNFKTPNILYSEKSISAKGFTTSDVYEFFFGLSYGVQIWNKLYKSEFIKKNNVSFDSGIYFAEDFLFNFKAYTNNPLITVLNEYTYYYLINSNSISNIKKERLTEQYLHLLNYMTKFLEEKEESGYYLDIFAFRGFTSIDSSCYNSFKYSEGKLREIKNELLKFHESKIMETSIKELSRIRYLKLPIRKDWKIFAWIFSQTYKLGLMNISTLLLYFRFKLKDKHSLKEAR